MVGCWSVVQPKRRLKRREGRRTHDLDIFPEVLDSAGLRKHGDQFPRFILRHNFYRDELGVVPGYRIQYVGYLVSRGVPDFLNHVRISVLQTHQLLGLKNAKRDANIKYCIRTEGSQELVIARGSDADDLVA